ncbi:hypothetical protein GGS21DRAFT_59574 [Xylaria nigripes]|nr:hypothetical protein GGS21DRAFT_59574 [Xylaria nigripes]
MIGWGACNLTSYTQVGRWSRGLLMFFYSHSLTRSLAHSLTHSHVLSLSLSLSLSLCGLHSRHGWYRAAQEKNGISFLWEFIDDHRNNLCSHDLPTYYLCKHGIPYVLLNLLFSSLHLLPLFAVYINTRNWLIAKAEESKAEDRKCFACFLVVYIVWL